MKFFLIYLLFRSILGFSPITILVLLGLLWLLDRQFTGFLPAAVAPIQRWNRNRHLQYAIAQNPVDVRSHVELGENLLRSGKHQAALTHLQRAMELGEDGARATYLCGAALACTGQQAAGIRLLEAALAKQHDVGYGEPYLYLLQGALETEGKNAARVEEIVRELEHFDSVEILARAGRICSRAGRKDLAQQLFAEALHNYQLTPTRLRRRQFRWVLLARFSR